MAAGMCVAITAMICCPAAHGLGAQYPEDALGASVSDSTVASGDTVTVIANVCDVGTTVDFFLDGSSVGSAITDTNGIAEAHVVITGTPGTHSISNNCNTSVLAITVGEGSGALPRTGTDPTTTVAADDSEAHSASDSNLTILAAATGMALLAMGAALIYRAGRRRGAVGATPQDF